MKAIKLKCEFFFNNLQWIYEVFTISVDKCKLLINVMVIHCTKLVGVISCRLEYMYYELYCSKVSFCLNMQQHHWNRYDNTWIYSKVGFRCFDIQADWMSTGYISFCTVEKGISLLKILTSGCMNVWELLWVYVWVVHFMLGDK